MLHVGANQEEDVNVVKREMRVRVGGGGFEMDGLRGDGTASRSSGTNLKDGEGRS